MAYNAAITAIKCQSPFLLILLGKWNCTQTLKTHHIFIQ